MPIVTDGSIVEFAPIDAPSLTYVSSSYLHSPFEGGLLSFVNTARNYFDLDKCVGYECWSQSNTPNSNWHYDKDERLAAEGKLSFPLCSMIYYVHVDAKGGQLHLEDDIITPKNNRLVIFSPGIFHGVDPYQGERVAFLVNPWDRCIV